MKLQSQLMNSLLLTCLSLFFFGNNAVAEKPLLKIDTKKHSYFGREIVHNRQQCWLMERGGQIASFPFADVVAFKKIAPKFKPYSAAQMRSRLIAELGQGFEVVGTTHYLVCAAPGHGNQYGKLFEQLYRESHVYFSTRGFQIKPFEFPLVAIIFPTHSQFVKYANAEGVRITAGLAGYYQLNSNRIAIFDPATSGRTTTINLPAAPAGSWFQNDASFARVGNSASSLQKTIIHEATHQVAFNIGLHSRLAKTPRWVVEGLAMVFEHPDARSGSQTTTRTGRLNRERYVWFGNYASKRRKDNALERFLSGDGLFQTQTLDAYSEAWALSFFLMETRSSQYVKYLKRLAQRPQLDAYTAKERLKDFHDAFGTEKKMQLFEAEYLRFIERM